MEFRRWNGVHHDGVTPDQEVAKGALADPLSAENANNRTIRAQALVQEFQLLSQVFLSMSGKPVVQRFNELLDRDLE